MNYFRKNDILKCKLKTYIPMFKILQTNSTGFFWSLCYGNLLEYYSQHMQILFRLEKNI